MKVKTRVLSTPTLSEPVLVGGLPGIGYVAKISADHLVEQLKAELFEEIYSHSFPPYVVITKDGTVELMKNDLYYKKKDSTSASDLILYTGNTQATTPEGQYDVAEEVLNVAERLGVRRLYTLAAYVTEKVTEKPRVFAAATETPLLEELKGFGVVPMEEGSIGGTNGLLFGLAKLRGIPAACLLGETLGYTTPSGRAIVDAKSSQAILEVLNKILQLTIDLTPLQNQAKMTEEFIQRLEDLEKKAVEQMARAAAPKERSYYI